jgi:adenylate cyclase
MEGRIVTINDAAMELLGCPVTGDQSRDMRAQWEAEMLNRYVWDVLPIDNLRYRLEDSLKTGAKHYVPEQSLKVALVADSAVPEDYGYALAMMDAEQVDTYWVWGRVCQDEARRSVNQVQRLERSVNLTVNPLTNPEGKRAGAGCWCWKTSAKKNG